MKYQNIREEELKNNVAQDYFWLYDCKKIIGNVDFCVGMLQSKTKEHDIETDHYSSLLWAEAKKGSSDVYKSLVQLILTIGKARTFDKYLPPSFLGAFDNEKIAFIPYNEIHEIFYLNDFNWNVTPSNYETKEFQLVYEKVKEIIDKKALLFNYLKDDSDLRKFIKTNFAVSRGVTKIKIDKNNFITIYNKWLETVKPTIQVDSWNKAKQNGIIDGDFYLADLLSVENKTLKEKLFVLLKADHYELDKKYDESGFANLRVTAFSDNQKAHTQFWNRYERPPLEEYWNYIMERRDLLVPQDIRERKGSFFTPRIWVELSQQYLAETLGKDWQDEYYIWDCAAGTGNLLNGLTNKYNIYASTLDKADVDVMKDRIQNGANLLEDHVFQFDFLNDDFTKLPQSLQHIINDEKKRKKLIIYINPPYAETAKKETHNKDRINKREVSFTKTQEEYANKIGIATKELFAQFLARIYDKFPAAILAQFSTLKIVQGPNFLKFRNFFKVEFQKGFIVPANTFDNVAGNFPIGFMIWKLDGKKKIDNIKLDIYGKDENNMGSKTFYAYDENVFITDWFKKYHTRIESDKNIGAIGLYGSDFQHNNFIRITNCKNHPNRWTYITANNLIESSIYFAVRKVIPATWLNDRDQFLYPNADWKTDPEFQTNCLTYTLFNNNIQSKYGVNHWIPFTQYVLNSRERLESNFMTDFIDGVNMLEPVVAEPSLFYNNMEYGDEGGSGCKIQRREFSETAKGVLKAGLALWKYYHAQPKCNVNASLYDIREHFQGRNENGKMNNKSNDETYNELIGNLRSALQILAKKIEPKIYEYGFLYK